MSGRSLDGFVAAKLNKTSDADKVGTAVQCYCVTRRFRAIRIRESVNICE
jgi:hypothetical protein